MTEVRNAAGVDAWTADELGNWELGGFGRLEASGVLKVQKFGSLELLGNSGVWKIRRIRKKKLYVAKKKTSFEPRRIRKIG